MLVTPRWWTGAGYANTFRPHQPGHCPSETSVLGTRWCESCSVPFKTMVGEAWVGGSWHHPSLGTSLSREAGRGPVLVTAPHALAFGAFLVPFCLFGWCFSKYSPKKAVSVPYRARSTWRGILCPWLSGQELWVSAAPPGCWCHPSAARGTPWVSSPFTKHIFIRLTSKGTDLFYFNEFGKGKWGSLEKQVPVRCGHTWAR